jgi:hypothetical protein
LTKQIIRPQKNNQRIRQSIYLSYNRPDILVAAIPDLSQKAPAGRLGLLE